ncbi:ribonuclease HI [Georgenia sp. TF02-10]|uniref:ribonuclease H family protein n=1 Tax=Georgenia sp. TF02-10 TaxID=2917725 RepID=UPI001FA6E827|nr:ribonuclease H [Georgenia sp. TF02-10]UNX56283.1 ribonuclease HI [Georgenia sp. TF02-10]
MPSRTWSTQTELGATFGLTAREIGTHLTALGLKDGSRATDRALAEGLASARTLRDGTPFHVWRTDAVTSLLEERGLTPQAGSGGPTAAGGPGLSATAGRPAGAGGTAAATAATRGVTRGTGRDGAATVPDARYDKVIATDGSALGNPGPTGWAWVDQTTGESESGGLAHGTNNVGELLALLRALQHAGPDGDLLVRADSQYVINTVTKWARGWQRRGWRKADGKVPENLQLIQDILALLDARTGRTDFEWVRGHAGDVHNERADALAVAAAKAAAVADAVRG